MIVRPVVVNFCWLVVLSAVPSKIERADFAAKSLLDFKAKVEFNDRSRGHGF
jgi:hypothetical protein